MTMAASDPSIGRLHHIGLAVPDLDAAMAHYAKLPGASILGPREPRVEGDGHHVLVVDASRSHGTLIELRQPT